MPFKGGIAETNFFLEINIVLLDELLKQWMSTNYPIKINITRTFIFFL